MSFFARDTFAPEDLGEGFIIEGADGDRVAAYIFDGEDGYDRYLDASAVELYGRFDDV